MYIATTTCEAFMYVGNIGWSRESIAGKFQEGKDIQVAVKALRRLTLDERKAIVATYPPIRVVDFQEQGYVTLDSHRLRVLRAILPPQTIIGVSFATYEEETELRNKLAKVNGGAWIEVRLNPNQGEL